MTVYTDAELETLLADTESDLVERKAALTGEAATKAREAICGFANDLPQHQRGGVLFVGARDDGAPSGLDITEELLLQLADMKTDGNILPPPTLSVQRRRLRGHDFAVVIVEPADAPPVSFKGRIWVRTGPRRGIATAQDERLLSEKRRYKDRPYDARPVAGATLDQLDLRYFDEVYLPAAFAADVLEANERSREERLTATKMVSPGPEPVPTVLGVLALGTLPRAQLPGAYIQFLRVNGTGLDAPVGDEQVIEGNLAAMLRRIDEKCASHNRRAVDFISAPTERSSYDYPPAALQQIIRNALLHRTYEGTNSPVRVYWYDDRIEVLSPGGPYGIVTAENFGSAGLTDYRNPNLAEALRNLGFVQRFGAGIAIARRELAANGNPPLAFTIDSTHVGVTLRARPA